MMMVWIIELLPLNLSLSLFLGDPKVKLYRDSDGELKGDGLCCYLKIESVQLALNLLDESEIRGKKLSVKRVSSCLFLV